MKVYIAASLFSVRERLFLSRLADFLVKQGFNVYLPHRDSGLIESNLDMMSKTVFIKNIEGIKESDLIIALVNGPEIDSGTSWEIGYAYALGKEIICITDDMRVNENTVNLMIYMSCSHFLIINDFNIKITNSDEWAKYVGEYIAKAIAQSTKTNTKL